VDKPIRNAIERATQEIRHILEAEFEAQLEGTYAILAEGSMNRPGFRGDSGPWKSSGAGHLR
jgi:hypothetical protein